MMSMGAANCFSVFFVALYGTEIGLINGGVYFTFAAVSMVSARLASRVYMDKVLPIKVLTFAVVIGLIGLVCLLFATQISWLFYVAGLLYGLELGMGLPINQSVSIKNSPSSRWGVASALFSGFMDLGAIISTLIYGLIIASFGFTVCILCAIAFMLIALILGIVFYPPWAKSEHANAKWLTQQIIGDNASDR